MTEDTFDHEGHAEKITALRTHINCVWTIPGSTDPVEINHRQLIRSLAEFREGYTKLCVFMIGASAKSPGHIDSVLETVKLFHERAGGIDRVMSDLTILYGAMGARIDKESKAQKKDRRLYLDASVTAILALTSWNNSLNQVNRSFTELFNQLEEK